MIPTILCLDCGEKSYGWTIETGDTHCATCGSENTVHVDEEEQSEEDDEDA